MTLRLSLLGAALAAFLVLGLLTLHYRKEAATERARADSAVVQEKVTAGTGAIADRVTSEHVIILRQTEEQAHAIEAIPSDDLPADVRERWCGGLRYSACGRSNTDGSHELPATVPGAEP